MKTLNRRVEVLTRVCCEDIADVFDYILSLPNHEEVSISIEKMPNNDEYFVFLKHLQYDKNY